MLHKTQIRANINHPHKAEIKPKGNIQSMATVKTKRVVESNEVKLARVGTKKVNAILKAFRTLSNLKGSTPVQRETIKKAIDSGLASALESMAGKKNDDTGFKL